MASKRCRAEAVRRQGRPRRLVGAHERRQKLYIFQTYFGGDAWVQKEAPVVSTDLRISVRLGQLGL